ncbi:hypothetical protein BC830DRAFT_1069867 [Chytriomyces sp. MP71]|nr:hypothetical protein BC830DRAFT_1069867 [Chytriomyces sp. MP71]
MAEESASVSTPEGITLTIRLIKSFEFRNFKNLVLHNVDPATTTPADLAAVVKQRVASEAAFKPYRNVEFDTFKLYMVAHGAKTQNLIINLNHDEDWIMDSSLPLAKQDPRMGAFEHECEISYFNKASYEAYKEHPENKW